MPNIIRTKLSVPSLNGISEYSDHSLVLQFPTPPTSIPTIAVSSAQQTQSRPRSASRGLTHTIRVRSSGRDLSKLYREHGTMIVSSPNTVQVDERLLDPKELLQKPASKSLHTLGRTTRKSNFDDYFFERVQKEAQERNERIASLEEQVQYLNWYYHELQEKEPGKGLW